MKMRPSCFSVLDVANEGYADLSVYFRCAVGVKDVANEAYGEPHRYQSNPFSFLLHTGLILSSWGAAVENVPAVFRLSVIHL